MSEQIPNMDPAIEKRLREKARELVSTNEVRDRVMARAKKNMKEVYHMLYPRSEEYREKLREEFEALLEVEIAELAETKFWQLVQNNRE